MKKKLVIILLLIVVTITTSIWIVRFLGNPERITAQAVKLNDPAVCEKIIVIPGFTWDLAGFLFTQLDKTHGGRVLCYMRVAKQNKNLRACELINSTYAGRCYVGMMEENVRTAFLSSGCGGFIGEQERKNCAEQLYPSLKQGYREICEKAVREKYRRDLCYLEAVQSLDHIEASITHWGIRDISLCSNIDDAEYRRICASQF